LRQKPPAIPGPVITNPINTAGIIYSPAKAELVKVTHKDKSKLMGLV
jgi:hypothetical protein